MPCGVGRAPRRDCSSLPARFARQDPGPLVLPFGRPNRRWHRRKLGAGPVTVAVSGPTPAARTHQRRPPPFHFQRQGRRCSVATGLACFDRLLHQHFSAYQSLEWAAFSRRQQHGGARSREPATFAATLARSPWHAPPYLPHLDFGEGGPAIRPRSPSAPGNNRPQLARPSKRWRAGAPPRAEIAVDAQPAGPGGPGLFGRFGTVVTTPRVRRPLLLPRESGPLTRSSSPSSSQPQNSHACGCSFHSP